MNTSSSQKFADSYVETQRAHNHYHKETTDKSIEKFEKAGVPYVNWTNAAIEACDNMMSLITASLYDDDVIADFGARNGHVADHLFDKYAMKVTCVDLLEEYAEECTQKGHRGICADLEALPLADDEVDWGFSHHCLEHTRDLAKVAAELTRVVRRGLFLVFPIETDEEATKNPSHMHHSTDPDYFIQHFISRGWKVGWSETGQGRPDFQCFLYK